MFDNYLNDTIDNVLEWLEENYTADELKVQLEDREEFEQVLDEQLWIEDSVTGNASGSFTFSRNMAKHNVMTDTETVLEALRDFCVDAQTIAEKFLTEDWEYFDVSARCYVLGQAINAALDKLTSADKCNAKEEC